MQIETSSRELFEEAGLHGEPYIVSTRHYRVYDSHNKNLIEYKFIYITVE